MASKVDRPMFIRDVHAAGFAWVNPAFRRRTGLTAADISERPFIDWVDPQDREDARSIVEAGAEGCLRTRHETRTGEPLPIEVSVRVSEGGTAVLGRDVSDDDVLGAYVDDFDRGTVAGTLETIARIVEDQNPGYRCSILLERDSHFARGAGPSLPEDYNAAIEGEAIGPAMGSCGTAIYWNAPVIVEDIQADPLWRPFAELAEKAGVAACWSHPFTDSSGKVLGALALYAPEPRAPTPDQLEALKASARLTGLAVERGRVEEALREQRRREAELEEQLRQAAKMEALGVLAGGVAHDFNNLLTTISGNAELALLQLPSGHPARGMLDRIVTTSQRAGEFCTQMLVYAGRGTIRTECIEVGRLLDEVHDLAHAALSKKAAIVYTLHEGPVYVDADENQLLQVVLSLITNGAEAIGDDEGEIEVSTAVVDRDAAALERLAPDQDLPSGEYVQLTVRDNGHGMDEATRERIFDPFFTTKFTGRGLGLAAVTGIVRRHAGAIRVESEPGVGTTFELLFPTVPAPERPEAVTTVSRREGPEARRVLVVDDEEEPRRVFRLALEHGGFEVCEAVDGEDALRVFRERGPAIDLVLLDLSMPRLGGHEVFAELRRLRPDIPVVLISGYSEEEVLRRLDGAPVAGVLRKPVTVAHLLETIRGVAPPSTVPG